MIARLTGKLAEIGADWAVIDVGGVGYLVACSARTLSSLGGLGDAVRLEVETRLREDALTLYGFSSAEEKRLFRLLGSVQGVGPKVALALLSTLSPDELLRAIAAADPVPLKRADGVGPKLAQRIVHELKDKVGALAVPASVRAAALSVGGQLAEDAVSALVHLGYGRMEAVSAVAAVTQASGAGLTLARLVPAALKELTA